MSDPQSVQFLMRDVSVNFKNTQALSGVSLSISRGESVALVGASGAGKTSLLRLLNASLLPNSGVVYLEGNNLASASFGHLAKLRSAVGFVHQNNALVPNLRVLQNVLLGRLGTWSFVRSLWEFLRPSKRCVEEVYQILSQVGIPEKLYERCDRLSGGQLQRVAIARALFQSPRALLADEPVSSVDPARARETIKLLMSLFEQKGLTLVVSLHNFELACEYFPRVIGLRRGAVLFDCAPEDISAEQTMELYRLNEQELLE